MITRDQVLFGRLRPGPRWSVVLADLNTGRDIGHATSRGAFEALLRLEKMRPKARPLLMDGTYVMADMVKP